LRVKVVSVINATNRTNRLTYDSFFSFWQAIDNFNGHVWASHNNVRALVDRDRQFIDEQIKALIKKGAVIGRALDAWMVVPGWKRGVSMPKEMNCHLEVIINHMDYICQIAGNTRNIGIGSDWMMVLSEKNNALLILTQLLICKILLPSFIKVNIQRRC